MQKVFLYLYPIEEYTRIFLYPNIYYESNHLEHPFDVLIEQLINDIDKKVMK